MNIKEFTNKYGYLVAIVSAYLAALLYMLFGLRMGIFHVLQQPAFLADKEFFMEWLPLPGGVGEYLSLFVEQFFDFQFLGGFLLVIEILLSAYLLVRLMERIFETKYGSKSLLWIVPLFVSMVCISNVYFDFATITRLVVMLAMCNIVHCLPKGHKLVGIVSAVSAVVIYHCCGPLYLYSFCAVELVLAILHYIKWLDFVWTLVMTAFYPALMYRFVLPLTPSQIFYSPSALRAILDRYQVLAIALFYLIVPVSILVQHWARRMQWADADAYVASKKNKTPILRRRWVSYTMFMVVLMGILVGVYNMYENKRERFSARMAWEIEHENWKYVIDNAMNFHGYDRNTNFYYDMALAVTGQLPDKLFNYPQLIGNEALLIELPMAGVVCYPSSSMYYYIGQISNALHYAYESIIYYKDSPYVLRRIIDCLIISGRYVEAEMFIKQLDRNMLAHKFVEDRRRIMAGQSSTQLTPEFIKAKHHIAVKRDYVMSPPYRNFEELFLANKQNKPALDYLLCYCLLAKDFDNFFSVIQVSPYNPKHLPRHYQEAVAMYRSVVKNPNKYSTMVQLDPMISKRFAEFANICKRGGQNAYPVVKNKFADTYWIYFAFENPMARNFSLIKNHPE
ncbi:MAG: DUF6057 family protein [Bacteroidales bacterium]|nr:DUF6057 family protein [Bacteroidales bacterium]